MAFKMPIEPVHERPNLRREGDSDCKTGATSAERRHDLFGDAVELLEHDGLRCAQTGAQIDVFHAREARLEFLQMLDQLLGRAGKPGSQLHIVVERRHATFVPGTPLCSGCHLRRCDARYKTKWSEHLDVFLVVWGEFSDRLL